MVAHASAAWNARPNGRCMQPYPHQPHSAPTVCRVPAHPVRGASAKLHIPDLYPHDVNRTQRPGPPTSVLRRHQRLSAPLTLSMVFPCNMCAQSAVSELTRREARQ